MTDDSKRALRNAFGAFPTGVTVITTREADGTPRGFTANSFTSVSLDPPILLICLAKTAHSCQVFKDAPHFAVNILGENQKEVSNLFASRSPTKFDEASWHPGPSNMPLLDGTLACFDCSQHRLVDAGDHLILLGKVEDFSVSEGNPLGYHRGGYFTLGVKQDLVEAAAKHNSVELSGLLQIDGKILLKVAADGLLTVPKAPAGTVTQEAFVRHFDSLGLKSGSPSLYAVYDDTDAGYLRIIFRNTFTGKIPQGFEVFKIDNIPFDRVSASDERSMLKRYAKEAQVEDFGIYQGNLATGTVHQISPS